MENLKDFCVHVTLGSFTGLIVILLLNQFIEIVPFAGNKVFHFAIIGGAGMFFGSAFGAYNYILPQFLVKLCKRTTFSYLSMAVAISVIALFLFFFLSYLFINDFMLEKRIILAIAAMIVNLIPFLSSHHILYDQD